jgi:hypothetical protein
MWLTVDLLQITEEDLWLYIRYIITTFKTSLCSHTLLFDNTKLMIPNWRTYLAGYPSWPFVINQLIIKQACSVQLVRPVIFQSV